MNQAIEHLVIECLKKIKEKAGEDSAPFELDSPRQHSTTGVGCFGSAKELVSRLFGKVKGEE